MPSQGQLSITLHWQAIEGSIKVQQGMLLFVHWLVGWLRCWRVPTTCPAKLMAISAHWGPSQFVFRLSQNHKQTSFWMESIAHITYTIRLPFSNGLSILARAWNMLALDARWRNLVQIGVYYQLAGMWAGTTYQFRSYVPTTLDSGRPCPPHWSQPNSTGSECHTADSCARSWSHRSAEFLSIH